MMPNGKKGFLSFNMTGFHLDTMNLSGSVECKQKQFNYMQFFRKINYREKRSSPWPLVSILFKACLFNLTFYKGSHSKGLKQKSTACASKKNKTFHRKAFSATFHGSTSHFEKYGLGPLCNLCLSPSCNISLCERIREACRW